VLVSSLLSPSQKQCETNPSVGVARGGKKGHAPPKFLENIVILCFERRFSIQNSVIRLKSNILAPPNFLAPLNFWAGYVTESEQRKKERSSVCEQN